MCTWPVLTIKSGEKQLVTSAGITVASYPDCWCPWGGGGGGGGGVEGRAWYPQFVHTLKFLGN